MKKKIDLFELFASFGLVASSAGFLVNGVIHHSTGLMIICLLMMRLAHHLWRRNAAAVRAALARAKRRVVIFCFHNFRPRTAVK